MTHSGNGTVAVIFISARTDADDEGYTDAAAEMEAAVQRMDGYIGMDSVRGEDGTGITISYWRDEEAAAAWRAHTRHSEVREEGRRRWYHRYRVVVARVERAYSWSKALDQVSG